MRKSIIKSTIVVIVFFAALFIIACRVVEDMDKKDQVSTMLEENMQRTDLTIWGPALPMRLRLFKNWTNGLCPFLHHQHCPSLTDRKSPRWIL